MKGGIMKKITFPDLIIIAFVTLMIGFVCGAYYKGKTGRRIEVYKSQTGFNIPNLEKSGWHPQYTARGEIYFVQKDFTLFIN